MFNKFIDSSGHNRATWADRLGISRSYLSDILNSKKRPSLDLAVKIQRVTAGAVPASSWIPIPAPPEVAPAPEEDAA